MKKRVCAAILAAVMVWGAVFAAAAEPSLTDTDKKAVLAALYEADIASTREALELGLVSSEELTSYYLARISQYNGPHNCFITLCTNALDEARKRDEARANGAAAGALWGIPVVVKDNMNYAGWPTTNGYAGKKAAEKTNAAVVDALLREGAVILGKTNMSTAAQDARASYSAAAGETKNAYAVYLSSGGSSGGTAVAVSLNFAMAGLGTDTNSSLRYPSSLNGCVTLRPTTGLLSNDGVVRLNRVRDTPGAITRTVADQAIMLDALTGGKNGYYENLNGEALAGLRIGVLQNLTYATSAETVRTAKNLDGEVRAAFSAAVEELRACGAEVVEVTMSRFFSLSSATMSTNAAGPRTAFYNAYRAFLQKNALDAVIFPTYLSAPLYSGVTPDGKKWKVSSQVYINNCKYLSPSAGVPEMTVPIGRHSRGAGIGMEIAGDKNTEQLLLDIAYSYTQRYDHRQVPDTAPDLYAGSYAGPLDQRVRLWREARNAPVAYAAPQTVQVDGQPVELELYALKDEKGNDTNYIRLRELAAALKETDARFDVGWDGNVIITTQTPYSADEAKGEKRFEGDQAYRPATARTFVDGVEKDLAAFVLTDDSGGRYTYYDLRELGDALGITVGRSTEGGVYLETK